MNFYGENQPQTNNYGPGNINPNPIIQQQQQGIQSNQQIQPIQMNQPQINPPSVQKNGLQGGFAERFQTAFKQQGPEFENNFKQKIAHNLAQNVMNNIFQEQMQQSKIQQEQQYQDNLEKEKTFFAKCCGCLTVEFYQPYFDVTTDLVKQRLENSFNPYFDKFFELNNGYKPDLYGPFWIYTTLIFTLAAAGNLSSYIQLPDDQVKNFNFNFQYVPFAATICYGLGFSFPIILSWLMQFFGTKDLGYIQMICIYGYSMAVYVPCSILCSYPSQTMQWAFMVYAMISSTFFMINNCTNYIKRYQENRQHIVQVIIFSFQLLFLIIYKLYFFDQIYYTYNISGSGTNQSFNNKQ